MSIVNSSTGEQHIRVCYDCRVLLDRRNIQIEEQRAKPTLCHFYDRMKAAIDDCDKLIPVYYKMCYSFSLGESNYNLTDAQDLRIKLMRMAETIDRVSRKIVSLGENDIPLPSPTQMQVQAKIRLSATHYLRENMIGLASLPSQEELIKVQEERRLEIERKIKLEKQQALEEQAKHSRSSSPTSSRRLMPATVRLESSSSNVSFELVSPDTGWGPETSDRNQKKSNRYDEVDPVLFQIRQVQSYIKRAREEHRYDEVNMLETNLKELEIEYFVQQQEQAEKCSIANGERS
jgi:rabenosyn-5